MSKAYTKEITKCIDCGFVYRFQIGDSGPRLSCAITHSEVNYNNIPSDCPLSEYKKPHFLKE